jgi:hypothetical protein
MLGKGSIFIDRKMEVNGPLKYWYPATSIHDVITQKKCGFCSYIELLFQQTLYLVYAATY